jgi:hypothetical protein
MLHAISQDGEWPAPLLWPSQLTPLEAHDLVCKVAEIDVVGGVRRWVLGWLVLFCDICADFQ